MKASDVAGSWRYVGVQWLVLALSLSLTYLFWMDAHHVSVQKHRADFDFFVADVANHILQRIAYDEQILHGVRAFYLNKRKMEPQAFAGYIALLEIEKNYPGIQSISFSPLVADADKSTHIDMQRKSGQSDYTIKPRGRRSSYVPVAFIYPLNAQNERVLGFDYLSDPLRRGTIELAMDQDRAVISEKLVLKQDNGLDADAGFLMILPVYRRGAVHDSPVSRRANADGWFSTSFRMSDLMADVLRGQKSDLGIVVYDGSAISEQSRMYQFPEQVSRPASPLFSTTARIKVSGHTWSMQVFSLPEFEAKRDKSGEYEVLNWGVLSSLSLSLFIWLLMRHQRRERDMVSVIGHESNMRRQAEKESHDLFRFNEVIFEKSPAGIAVYKYSGPCVMANDAYARSIGGTVSQLLKQDFRLNASWQRNGRFDLAIQALDSGLTIRRDIEGVTSFGRDVVMECIFSRVDIFGELHLLVIANDISDRVSAERSLNESMHKLERKELAKSRFLAAAGHDLRQPLTAANMYVYALKFTALNARQHELVHRMEFSLSTLGGLLDSLLNVSRLDAGRIKPDYTSINVSELIIWLEQNFAPMAKEKQLGFRLYFPVSKALFVRGDSGLVKSVLMNLVSNAIKFTVKGAILVSARVRGSKVLFQVWDTGLGIPDECIEHIFEEFYQVENPQRDRGYGLGLGLSIVERTLTLLGSEIGCRSQSGRGTVFEFCLPSDGGAQLCAINASDGNIDDRVYARGKRFIVLEDDALVAQAMNSCLTGMGAEVKCFRDAEEALCHAGSVDYYVVDYMLGGELNGLQFLNRLRQQSAKPIYAVLMTGDTSSAFIRESAEFVWPIQYKPVNISELFASLRAQEQRQA
jgi:PAS domain S-box-containing protein